MNQTAQKSIRQFGSALHTMKSEACFGLDFDPLKKDDLAQIDKLDTYVMQFEKAVFGASAEEKNFVPTPAIGRKMYALIGDLEAGKSAEAQSLRAAERYDVHLDRLIVFYNDLANDNEWKPYRRSKHELFVKKLSLSDMFGFTDITLEFSKGINLIFGENATGKSNLLKLIFFLIRSNEFSDDEEQAKIFNGLLSRVFNVSGSDELIRFESPSGSGTFAYNLYNSGSGSVNFRAGESWSADKKKPIQMRWDNRVCFIPSKEIISYFSGLIVLIESGQLQLDETYLHLAKLLTKPKFNRNFNLRTSEILKYFDDAGIGELTYDEENNRMFIYRGETKRPLSVSMEAEGYRKLHVLRRLIANGSIQQGGVLIWDEPESNFNPKLLNFLLDTFITLSRAGVQIFLATHSSYIGHYLDFKKDRDLQVLYHNLYKDSKNAGEIKLSSGSHLSELDHLAAIDAATHLLEENIEPSNVE